MALFTWSTEYSVKVIEIDLQHENLFAMINELHDSMRAGNGKELLEVVLQDLVTYTKTHFAAEERFMKLYQYPGYPQHKAAHDAFVTQALDLQQKFTAGKTMITIEVMNVLKDWLVTHIKGVDQQLGPYLVSKGVR
ncbi:MAG: bacteriohemerythrin [Armatimonadota bacterium]